MTRSPQERWWLDTVIYQVYPRSFADSNGDGVGDLPGITSRLDHIAALGAGAIWLCPFYPSPGFDGGYDVADYFGVDPQFGTLDDADELFAQAHERGLRVILDVVVNHTSHEHPWFRQAAEIDSPLRSRYVWANPRAGFVGGEPGAEPTEWRAAFGGSAWTWHPASGQYYLGVFSAHQPDLNWANPELRAAVAAMLRWWLDRGVDGFRLDVINLIDKTALLDDTAVAVLPAESRCQEAATLTANGPRVSQYLSELRRAVLGERRDILLLGETPGVSVEQAAALTDPVAGPLDLVFAFEHCELDREPERWKSTPFDLRDLKDWAIRWHTGPGQGVWNSLFWSSHDQARIVSRYGDDGPGGAPESWWGPGPQWARSATAWATIGHAHRGTPFVYQGDEIAMTNFPFGGIDDFADIEAHGVFRDAVAAGTEPARVLAGLRRLSRDNARTPMQWDSSPGAGFTSGSPWLAVNPNHSWLSVAAQRADRRSVLAYYRELIALRRREPVVACGDVRILLPTDRSVYAVERTDAAGEGCAILFVVNASGQCRPWPRELASWTSADVIVTNSPQAGTGLAPRAGDDLEPWDARVLRSYSTNRTAST